MDGILIVDKPKEITSHDVVDFIRKRFKVKKAGHAGTLDPQATGVLVILLGKFTKKSGDLASHNKEYEARLTLGVATDSMDRRGRIIKSEKVADYSLRQLEEVFGQFLGKIKQVPPMFSALKYKGSRLYTLARQGIEVPRRPREVYIYKLKISKFESPHIYFTIKCSKGTYIRTLCRDIAEKLATVGHMSELRRISCGPFTVAQAVSLGELKHFPRQKLREILLNDETR